MALIVRLVIFVTALDLHPTLLIKTLTCIQILAIKLSPAALEASVAAAA